MPELPEVEALKDFLADHLVGREVVRVLPVAISVLKTYDPPVTAFEGREVTAVRRLRASSSTSRPTACTS